MFYPRDAQGLLEQELAKLRATLKKLLVGATKKDVTAEGALEVRLCLLNQRDNLLTFRSRLLDAISTGQYQAAAAGGGAGSGAGSGAREGGGAGSGARE